MDASLGSINQRIDLLRFYNPPLSRKNHTMHPGDLLTIPEDAFEPAMVMDDPQPQGTEAESAQAEDHAQLVTLRETGEDKLSDERPTAGSDNVDQVISLHEVRTSQEKTRQMQSDIIHLQKTNEQLEQRFQHLRN